MERVIHFYGGPRAVGAARDAVLEYAPDLPAPTLEDIQLLVSEVVTNAVRHGGAGHSTPIEVRIVQELRSFRVEVTDAGPGFERQTPTPRTNGGWGLLFVDRLATRWNVDRPDGHTRVWFELDVPAAMTSSDGAGARTNRSSGFAVPA